jgi:NAD-dependent SIR2 family protein deacetylase
MIARCEKCGEPIKRINKMFTRPIPEYCPSCSAKFSIEDKKKVINYEYISFGIGLLIFLITIGIFILFH